MAVIIAYNHRQMAVAKLKPLLIFYIIKHILNLMSIR